ncbi:hypothetical protein [Streptomyces sp. NPDC060022]|uniref:hypothetical protein n=1 Tax=Streptomyces sp. NPDC060022 TaxID=3347039 RepID=UPI00369B7448
MLHAHVAFVTKYRHKVFKDAHLDSKSSHTARMISSVGWIVRHYIEQQNRPL